MYLGPSYSIQAIQELLESVRCDSRSTLLHTFVQSASAKVQAKVRLSANLFAPLHELISSEGVGLDADPCKLRPGAALVPISSLGFTLPKCLVVDLRRVMDPVSGPEINHWSFVDTWKILLNVELSTEAQARH